MKSSLTVVHRTHWKQEAAGEHPCFVNQASLNDKTQARSENLLFTFLADMGCMWRGSSYLKLS